MGPDSICPELIFHAGAALKSWFRDFLSSCLRRLKIPKIWRRALVVAIPKPGKPVGDPKSYRPISLLYVPYKILERLIYARVKPLIDPLLPIEQAGFRRGKSTEDQVVLLTQNIEDFFEAKKKAGAVFTVILYLFRLFCDQFRPCFHQFRLFTTKFGFVAINLGFVAINFGFVAIKFGIISNNFVNEKKLKYIQSITTKKIRKKIKRKYTKKKN